MSLKNWIKNRDRRIDGEYDPPYEFNENPTEEQRQAAQRIVEKYERLAKEKAFLYNKGEDDPV